MTWAPEPKIHVWVCQQCGRDWIEGDLMPAICERSHAGKAIMLTYVLQTEVVTEGKTQA